MDKSTFKKVALLITYAVGLFLIVGNIGQVMNALKTMTSVLSPLILGICIAFVLNLILNLYEKKILKGLWNKFPKIGSYKRGISVTLTYLTLIAFIVAFSFIVVPQIVKSGSTLVDTLPKYARIAQDYITDITEKFNIESGFAQESINNWKDIIGQISNLAGATINKLIDIILGVTNGIMNPFLSTIFSIYILAKKEKLIGILKKVLYALCPKKRADSIYKFSSESSNVFSRFVGGQLTEALILGILCCIGMLIFKLPYAPLISMLVGLMNLVPVLGAYISAIPSAIIIALESPTKAIIFLVFIIVLQQIDGNMIYPKVVGNAIGLDGFWVLLSITLGGSLFGIAGMLVAVPIMAIIYSLIRNIINYLLAEKQIAKEDIE